MSRLAVTIMVLALEGAPCARAGENLGSAATGAELVGRVQATNGAPLPAAVVFVSTAQPKIGISPFCPSCYADCTKSAKSDSRGQFKITGLSRQLIFRLLAVAKGYQPRFVPNVDPAMGEISVALEPITLEDMPPDHVLHGRVVDATGAPIVSAVVAAYGIVDQSGRGMWGLLPGVDPLCVADENGDFVIFSRKAFVQMDVQLSARGFANQTFAHLASGKTIHTLVMTEGDTLSGRVVRAGQPMPNVSVGIVSVDRTVEHYTGHFEIGTDAAGRFSFFNLPPNTDYYVYGLMETIRPYGAVPLKKVHVGADGQVVKVGDLTVERGYCISGRVLLADGKKLPPHTWLVMSRSEAWDSLSVQLGEDGRFDFHGVPAETVELAVRVKHYHVSSKNRSFDVLNGSGLVGQVNRDVTDLQLLLEKGEQVHPDISKMRTETDWAALPQYHALRGAEGP